MAEMTGEARVVALDRLRPGDIADCSGELLDVLREALALGHNYIGTEHILLGLLDEEESLGGGPLAGLGITKERARDWLVPVLEQMAAAKRQGGQPG